MLDALEAKWKLDIPCCHLVIGFLLGFAPFLLNRYEVGKNGWTSFERCKGKRARIVGIEFGESVMWKKTFGGGAVGKSFQIGMMGIFGCTWQVGRVHRW